MSFTAPILHVLSPAFFSKKKVPLILGLAFTLHALLGAAVGLSIDEAHYLLYALHPAWSYFDHPPLVGWLQWPLVTLNAPIGLIRLVPGLLWLLTVWLVYRLTKNLQGTDENTEQAGLWAVLALSLAPLLHLLGLGLLPDTLLIFLTVAVMWQTLHLEQASLLHRPLRWLVLGFLLGLAGLSKYTAIFLGAAVGVSLVAMHGWRVLRNPWLWVAVFVALAMVMPVAVWNAQNNWVSFSYQAKHGSGNVWQLIHVVQFLLLQLLAYGPLLLWAWTGWRHESLGRTRVFLSFFAIPFAALVILSGGATSLPHWSAPAWVALAPFAGIGLARAMRKGQKLLIRSLACLQMLFCVLLLGLMFTAGLPFLAQSSGMLTNTPNPFADLHGWEHAGQRAIALARQEHLGSVAVQNWTLASRLAWYARPLPIHVLEDRFDQFDLWAGELPPGDSTLLVDWSHMAYEVPLGTHGFHRCTLLDTVHIVRWGIPISTFRFLACHNWSGNPRPVLATPITS